MVNHANGQIYHISVGFCRTVASGQQVVSVNEMLRACKISVVNSINIPVNLITVVNMQ